MSVNPKPQTIDSVFGNKKYYIDFYQREYKWQKDHVESLLDDIFYKFAIDYKNDLDVTPEIINGFGWYYLNTYVTNEYNGKMFIVDGQQRFTTITLILIKLFRIAQELTLSDRLEWIKNKIYGTGAEGKSYWMGQDGRYDTLDGLLNNKQTIACTSISTENMYNNFKFISSYLDDKLKDEGNYNNHKYESFLLYFLLRLVFVEILIDDASNVPMVFEVINDRGEKLKPYEVFKGELLGQIDKNEIDEYYKIWQQQTEALTKQDEKEIDNFFRFYFRSKYTNNRNEYRDFDGEYNKVIFSKKWDSQISFKRNPNAVKSYLKKEFKFYSDIYEKSLQSANKDGALLFFNALNEQDRQFLLIFSAIKYEDDAKEEKINLVAKLFDRNFTLLQLFGCYDSNNFTESILSLNTAIRNKSAAEITEQFDNQLKNDISKVKGIEISNIFQYSLFKEANNSLGIRFIRYFFARIDHFIAKHIKVPTDNYYNMVRNTGNVNGYHVEHILADNKENRALFQNDEELFYKERNRLGALLILKGRDNLSSNAEVYHDKLKTYSHGTILARTLTKDFYHKHPDFRDFCNHHNLSFSSIDVYDQTAVETRQKLLFELIKIIWK